jgi:hypothetical protein
MNDVEIDISAAPAIGTLTIKTFKQLALKMTLTAVSATGINTIYTVEPKNDGHIYTLQGIRVDNHGKGIYIRNGKKIIIK